MSTWYDAGRRIGLHTAIAQLTARKQQLFEIYNASQIERICDIYDIKYHEAEACLAIVQQILEAKMGETYQGPFVNPPVVKCPLPRIGSKDWGWTRTQTGYYKSPLCDLEVCDGGEDAFHVIITRGPSIDGLERLSDAFRIAELLARRDWRRENRGKK